MENTVLDGGNGYLDDRVALRWTKLRLQDDLEGLLLGAHLPIQTNKTINPHYKILCFMKIAEFITY